MLDSVHQNGRVPAVSETLDLSTPKGLSIVGMAQAGKSTLRNAVVADWLTRFSDTTVYDLSNSNGYRGVTADILAAHDVDPTSQPTEDAVIEMLDASGDILGDDDLLDTYYRQPRGKDILRTPAVNAAVSVIAAQEGPHVAINDAATRHIGDVISNPTQYGLSTTPSLVVIDARNGGECEDKFAANDITSLACFILVCDEAVVVDRIPPSDNELRAELSRDQRIAALKLRNETDRSRSIGRMTLPEDYLGVLPAHQYMASGRDEDHDELFAIGQSSASCFVGAPIVIDTEHTTQEQVQSGIPHILDGALSAVLQNSRNSSLTKSLNS